MRNMPAMAKSKPCQDVAARLWRNIEALLAHHRITKNQLGQQTGINNGGVQRLEGGQGVAYQTIEKVAQHYGYTAADLLSPDFNPAMRRVKPDEQFQRLLAVYPHLSPRQRESVADLAVSMHEENVESESRVRQTRT